MKATQDRPDHQGDAQRGEDEAGDLTLDVPPGDPVTVYNAGEFDLARVVHRWYFGIPLLFALVGVALTARRWREISLLWFVQVSMTLTYVIFTRYRRPLILFLLFLFSAYTLVWVWD